MNDTMIGVLVSVALIGVLVVAAFYLDRRAKGKGDLMTGEKHKQQPGTRTRFYLSLLATFVGIAVVIWGYFSNSWLLMVLGGLLFVASIGIRYYWRIRDFIAESKNKNQT
jgi:hypothetical protein